MNIEIDISTDAESFGIYASSGYEIVLGSASVQMTASQFGAFCETVRPWVIADKEEAAPDLYEALKEAMHFMETADIGPPKYVTTLSRAALAKARGES